VPTGERYRVLRPIKRGGMAEVLEAVFVGTAGFERRVAIKRLLPRWANDESSVRSFIDEAQILSRLHHSNVLAVLDFGMMDDQPFQVLEIVDGFDLIELRTRASSAGRAIPPEIAAHIVAEVAHGLAHAHGALDEQGQPLRIVHRDVSPHNILVSYGGDVKLGDFGIAFARERLEQTRVGVLKGKPSFMAPEQWAGEVDARSDLYALGLVLHYLLSGVVPTFPNDGRAIVADLDRSLPEDLLQIVQRALAPKADRYPTAAAMAADCGRAVARRSSIDARSALIELMDAMRAPTRRSPDVNALFNPVVGFDDAVSPKEQTGPTIPGTSVVGMTKTPLIRTIPSARAATEERSKKRVRVALGSLLALVLAAASLAAILVGQGGEAPPGDRVVPQPAARGAPRPEVESPAPPTPAEAPVELLRPAGVLSSGARVAKRDPARGAPSRAQPGPQPVQEVPIDLPAVERQLDRIDRELRAAARATILAEKRAQLERLEGVYLDLRSSAVPPLGRADCEALAARAAVLEEQIRASFKEQK
jgi:serine/threonine-protein kinase